MMGSLDAHVTDTETHSSQKYINRAVYYHILRQEKLIRQGPAKADTVHKNEGDNILRQMGHRSFSRWLC